jgi:flagellar basal-body rod modification protein FlgD
MSSVTSTNGFTNASGAVSSSSADSNNTVNQDQFLKLLVTQLQNQDPNNPTDQTQMLAQLAQFSSLSEMTTLNSTMSNSAQFNQMAQSASLIGKTVTAGTTASPVTGTVSYVTVQGGEAYLNIGGQDVDASTVTQVQ